MNHDDFARAIVAANFERDEAGLWLWLRGDDAIIVHPIERKATVGNMHTGESKRATFEQAVAWATGDHASVEHPVILESEKGTPNDPGWNTDEGASPSALPIDAATITSGDMRRLLGGKGPDVWLSPPKAKKCCKCKTLIPSPVLAADQPERCADCGDYEGESAPGLALLPVSKAATVARYTCDGDGEPFTASQYAEDNEEPLDPRILALKVGEKVTIDHGAGGLVDFERIADAKLTKFTVEIEVLGDPGEAQDVVEATLDNGIFQDEINEGGSEEHHVLVTSAALVGVASVAESLEDAEDARDNRTQRLVAELTEKHPTHGAWTFDYFYPGCFSYYRKGDDLRVFFTPDHTSKGLVDFQVSTNDGDNHELYVWPIDEYTDPLTSEHLFGLAVTLMDRCS